VTWTRLVTRHIRADRATVFNLLAEVGLWPALFPHVRSARVLRRDGRRRLIVVRARWRWLPLGYTAIQTVDATQGRMIIRHVSRLTHGSVTVWDVQAATDAAGGPTDEVELSVHQHVAVSIPLVGTLLARSLVGGRVARDRGHAMLERVKEIAEGGSLADRR
jgi:hypothetical protein